MGSIRPSPKYGLNPTIPICFFCGEQKHEVALLGRISNRKMVRTAWGGESEQVFDSDVEAPRNMLLDYEPCDECKAKFSEGVLLIEVTQAKNPEEQKRAIQGNLVPNGTFALLKEEAFNRIFEGSGVIRKAGEKVLLEYPMLQQLMADYQKAVKEEEDKEENEIEDVLNWEIERFEMPAHVTKVLKAADIDYVCEITDLTLSELKAIDGLGKKSLDWILARLDYFGLKLREEKKDE